MIRAQALLLVALLAAEASAQETRLGRLTGVVFDSVAGRPLAGAVVTARGGDAVDTTDTDGRYELRLGPGPALLTFEHPRVSDWSLLRHRAEASVAAGATTSADLATASPSTVLERACGGVGTVVGGVVRDLLTLVPIPGAQVTAARPSGGPSTVSARENGEYQVCLGRADRVALDARLGSDRSRSVSLTVPGGGVVARDLFVPASRPATLSGAVMDGTTGEPLGGVTIAVVGSRLRAGTREDGSFLLRGLPPGSIGLVVERIGYGSGQARIDAQGGDSVHVEVQLFAQAVEIQPMVVTVQGPERERIRMGTRFDGLDRPEIEKLLPRSIDFDDLLRNANIPGLKIRDTSYLSGTGIIVQGVCVESSRRSTYVSDQCEMVEVYLNGVRMPEPEIFLKNLAPGDIERFELLSRSEAAIQYGGTPRARNGVLLIFTRGR